MQEQMVKTMAWKKMRGLSDNDQCWLCWKQKETVQHLLAGYQKLASTLYVWWQNDALKVLMVRCAITNGILPTDENWTKGRVIHRNGYELLWGWEHLRTTNMVRQPDLMFRRQIKEDDLRSQYAMSVWVEHPQEEDQKTGKIPATGVWIAWKMWTIQDHDCTLWDCMLGRQYKTINQGH